LIKNLDVHEGLWGIYLEFQFTATNIPTASDGKSFLPAAVSIVKKLGIQRFDQPSNFTVDAAEVNPGGVKKKSPK